MNALLSASLGKSGEAVKAGPIGLAVILLLCIACYFLFKSMSKHLRNVRENFPDVSPKNDPTPGADAANAPDQRADPSTAP